jgi:hypothetical protein
VLSGISQGLNFNNHQHKENKMTVFAKNDLAILNKSAEQLSSHLTAAHQERSAYLLQSRAPVAAAPAGDTPSSTNLNDILNNVVKAPSVTSITAVASQPDNNMDQMLGQVQTLDSYISLLTAFCLCNEHPAPFDISKPLEASQFTRSMAKWRNYVATGGAVKAMAGYLPVSGITTENFSKSVTSADLHFEFLNHFFGDFSLPEKSRKQLDSILTKVAGKLGSLNMSFEQQSDTLDHFLTYYYFDTVSGTGGPDQPPPMYICNVRLFYFHIDQTSWKASVGKSSVNHFSFNMNYFISDTRMNSRLVATDMDAINSTIRNLTSKTAQQVNESMNMQGIEADPRKT